MAVPRQKPCLRISALLSCLIFVIYCGTEINYGTRNSFAIFRTVLKRTGIEFTVETLEEYLSSQARKNQVKGVQCSRIFSGDFYNETEPGRWTFLAQRAETMTSWIYLNTTGDCDRFRKERGYFTLKASDEEENFPLAFTVITYKDFPQVERLLRAIYRPQNFYCIHYDLKSSKTFKRDLMTLSKCFDNVVIASRIISVQWGHFSVLESDLICMKDLLKYKKWKYLINLTGQEYPLKTNLQIVKILQAYKGANDVAGTRRRNYWRTQKFEPAPHNITLFMGSVHVILSRPFVEFMFNDIKSREFLNWTKPTRIPDETYFTTLQHNPQLGTPGAFNGTLKAIEDKMSMSRYKLWHPKFCAGKRARSICIFSQGDLPAMKSTPFLFANKFHYNYGELALECMEELHWNTTRDEYLSTSNFNVTFYEQLTLVRQRVNVNGSEL